MNELNQAISELQKNISRLKRSIILSLLGLVFGLGFLVWLIVVVNN